MVGGGGGGGGGGWWLEYYRALWREKRGEKIR